MSLYSQFQTDAQVEKAGIVLEYGTKTVVDDNGNKTELPISIRIARAGGANKAYERLMEAEVKPYKRMIQNETIETAVVQRILRKVYAQTIVLGWENIDFAETDNGPAMEDVPFTVENCIRLFTDLPDLFKDIQEQSQRAALFRAEVREADAKN